MPKIKTYLSPLETSLIALNSMAVSLFKLKATNKQMSKNMSRVNYYD